MDAKTVTERIQEHCQRAQETCKRVLDKIKEMKGERNEKTKTA